MCFFVWNMWGGWFCLEWMVVGFDMVLLVFIGFFERYFVISVAFSSIVWFLSQEGW